MKKFALACIAAILTATPAAASDLYTGSKDQPTYTRDTSWTGPYIGIHGGWAGGDWSGTLTYEGAPETSAYSNPDRTLDANGWVGGGQIGFNQQFDSWVLGAEADISATDFGGSATYVTDLTKSTFAKTHDFSLDYFGTLRGRVGFAADRWLLYVTGGLAWGETEGSTAVAYTPSGKTEVFGTSYASAGESHLGWTAGAGVETMVGGGWRLKAEWLYVDLGEQNYDFKGLVFNDPARPFETDGFESDLTFNVFRVGLNYPF